jgi:hypothetical protein
MRTILSVSAVLFLFSIIPAAQTQTMVVHTRAGIKNITVSSIDSITFTAVNDSVIFDNGNIYGVSGVNSPPMDSTRFTITTAMVISYLQDYHYYNGGHLPGTISLRHSDGTMYGPFQTSGLPGQGGVPNAYWICFPEVTIKAGSYVVIDSDPGTWSNNSGSSGQGFSQVKGYPAQ